MRAEVTQAFKWYGDDPVGVEVAVGSVVEGSCAVNAIDMGCAVELKPKPRVLVVAGSLEERIANALAADALIVREPAPTIDLDVEAVELLEQAPPAPIADPVVEQVEAPAPAAPVVEQPAPVEAPAPAAQVAPSPVRESRKARREREAREALEAKAKS